MQITTKEYRQRLENLSKLLKATKQSACIVLPTAHSSIKSYDQRFPHFQDRDFLYFTGMDSLENAALIVSTQHTKPILVMKKVSAKQRLWDGPGFDPKGQTSKLGIELVEVEDLSGELIQSMRDCDVAYLNPARSEIAAELATALLSRPIFELRALRLPTTISNAQTMTDRLRSIKSDTEIQMIRNAVSLTESALVEVLQITRPGCTEIQLARLFEGLVREAGGRLAFETIVASGPNAAVLHHTPTERKLAKGELVLFDVGAEFNGYNGDISRTISLGAPSALDKVLTHVDKAQEQIANLLKIGASLSKIKLKSVEIIAEQLHRSGFPVKGTAAQLVKSGDIKKYFPHSFGHSLGLDVHDPIDPEVKLAAGMVFTVEPGIYSSQKVKNFSPFGIRIEDDFFVSKTGPKIFSSIPQLITL